MKKILILPLSLILQMRRILFNSESGVILPIVIILMLALTITGLAFLNVGVMENSLVRREIRKNQAFYLAEAGLERTKWNLKQDFENGSRDWADGEINGITVGAPDEESWRVLGYEASSLLLDEGSYLVKVKYVDEKNIWVRSIGTVENASKTVQIYMSIRNISPWDNAIFAGTGMAGQVINGNARVHGSVHILGEGLGANDLAIDMSGTAGMRNNYQGLPGELTAVIPPCPQTDFNGETVESLEAKLWVKQGKVGLSGTAVVGETDFFGNSFKETVDAVYVTDGYGGDKGEDNVYSDNGTENKYDLGNAVQFPSLKDPWVDPVTETSYSSYLAYLNSNSLTLTKSEISSEVANFTHSDALGNSISWDQANGILEVHGIILVNGNLLKLGKKKETITYRGNGTIVVAHFSGEEIVGDIEIHADFLAEANFPSGNVGGLIANNIYLATGGGDSHLKMTAAFYAETKIVSQKQNEIAGTLVSNYFDMGNQVPRIYQVPDLALQLPRGMDLGKPVWYISTSQWSELSG